MTTIHDEFKSASGARTDLAGAGTCSTGGPFLIALGFSYFAECATLALGDADHDRSEVSRKFDTICFWLSWVAIQTFRYDFTD